MIDEAQDTSALQVAILGMIFAQADGFSTRFFIVGDPAQSIFGFADARPALMESFASAVDARTDLEILGNYRSGWPVIRDADLLQPRGAPMTSLGEAAAFTEVPRHVHAGSPLEAVYDSFIPWLDELGVALENAAVLAAQWFPLYHLARELYGRGVPVVGPGARPYRRRNLIAPLAETMGAYEGRPTPERFRRIQLELYRLVSELTGLEDRALFGFEGARIVVRLLRASAEGREADPGAVAWLRDMASSMANVLVDEEAISGSHTEIINAAAIGIEADMRSNGVDPASMSVNDMGVFGDPAGSLRLMSLHRAKGREFDAVAIVSVHEGVLPFFAALDEASVAESRRLLYVGITRARRALMYCTDTSHYRNRPSRFLIEVLESR